MDEALRLEYACTAAEIEEAKSLVMVRQIGAGSKWRALAIQFLILLGILLAVYFRVESRYRPYMFAFIAIATVVAVLWKQRSGRRPNPLVTVEVTVEEIRMSSARACSPSSPRCGSSRASWGRPSAP